MGLYANNRLFEQHLAAVEGKAIEYGQVCKKAVHFKLFMLNVRWLYKPIQCGLIGSQIDRDLAV